MKINNSKSVNKANKDEALALRDSVCLFRGPPKFFGPGAKHNGIHDDVINATIFDIFILVKLLTITIFVRTITEKSKSFVKILINLFGAPPSSERGAIHLLSTIVLVPKIKNFDEGKINLNADIFIIFTGHQHLIEMKQAFNHHIVSTYVRLLCNIIFL